MSTTPIKQAYLKETFRIGRKTLGTESLNKLSASTMSLKGLRKLTYRKQALCSFTTIYLGFLRPIGFTEWFFRFFYGTANLLASMVICNEYGVFWQGSSVAS